MPFIKSTISAATGAVSLRRLAALISRASKSPSSSLAKVAHEIAENVFWLVDWCSLCFSSVRCAGCLVEDGVLGDSHAHRHGYNIVIVAGGGVDLCQATPTLPWAITSPFLIPLPLAILIVVSAFLHSVTRAVPLDLGRRVRLCPVPLRDLASNRTLGS